MDDATTDATGVVQVRPYQTEGSTPAASSGQRKPRAFQPTPPSLRRKVEKVTLECVPKEESVESLLQDAARQQIFQPNRAREEAVLRPGIMFAKPGGKGGGPGVPLPGALGAPRKAKERKEGGSMDLRDLAFTESRTVNGQVQPVYAPVSLPYFDVIEDEEEGVDAAEGGGRSSRVAPQKTRRPQLLHVDEENANAAKLFLADGGLVENQFYLVQLPTILPPMSGSARPGQQEGSSPGASIDQLPDGRLGKLRVYKSGKVRMEIGGMPFCVDQGSDTFFRQELACVSATGAEIINLGQIQQRIVLTPDLDTILQELDKEPPDASMPPPPPPMSRLRSSRASASAGPSSGT